MMTFQQDLPVHPLTPSFNFTPMAAFKPSLDHLQALQQIFQTSNSSSLVQQPSLVSSKQSIPSNSCSNGFCQITASQTKNITNQKQVVEQAKALGINVVCVNCGQHDFKSLLERVQQDGEPFLLMNSAKIGQLTEFTPSDPPQKSGLSFYPLLSQQSPYQPNNNNNTNNPMNTQSDPLSLSFFSTVSASAQMAPSSSSSTSNKSPSTSSISTNLFNNQSSTLTKPTNNVNNNNTNTLPFPQNNLPLFPYSDLFQNYLNKQQQQFPQQPQQYQQLQQQQQQQQLNFQQQLQNIQCANLNSPFTSNNPLLQQALSVPQFTLPPLFGAQEQTLKINLPGFQNNPKLTFQPVTLQPNEEGAQSGVTKPIIQKPIELQQEEDDENEQYPSTKRNSIASAASKQKRGLFKKRPSISQNKTQKEFKVKLEGEGSGSTSQNTSLSENLENDSDDSFSEGCQAANKKQSARRSTETNTQLTPAELEKQNKIRERRKTNNFGHIYTWLKNQIRLYYGDRELYEQIQTYFTRVNKYSEVVTDESSSKWQYFLFQIKENSNLKEFLKDKIKSEHFREYIKTRKGKDQRVFYEFRIGVIYGNKTKQNVTIGQVLLLTKFVLKRNRPPRVKQLAKELLAYGQKRFRIQFHRLRMVKEDIYLKTTYDYIGALYYLFYLLDKLYPSLPQQQKMKFGLKILKEPTYELFKQFSEDLDQHFSFPLRRIQLPLNIMIPYPAVNNFGNCQYPPMTRENYLKKLLLLKSSIISQPPSSQNY